MEATREQKLAIDKRGTSLLVAAAAGSGKTRVLVERVIKLIIEEGVGLDRMLIVTFTKAAAGEMRERIRENLRKAAKDEKDEARRSYLRRQLSIVARANISTFHVFALEVIRRYYHVAGLSPGLSVMDDARKAILKGEAMDELLAENFEKASPGFLDLMTAYGSLQNNDGVRNIIMSVYDLMESLPDPEGWLKRAASLEDFDPEIYMRYAGAAARKTFRIARGYFAKVVELLDETPLLQKMAKDDLSQVDAVISILETGDTTRALEAAKDIKFAAFRAANAEKPAYEAVRDKVSYCRDAGKDMIRKKLLEKIGAPSEESLRQERALMQPALEELRRLTLELARRYAQKKAAKKLIDYSDMEHFALKILENEQVCAEYREKFEHIFVDEYQDSNSIQETLISRIARPDNVFMVGDVKQCIYKFRQAEPELFMEKYRRFKAGGKDAGGEVIDLNSNFRSRPEVIECVNSVFRELMTEESAGIAYDDDAALREGIPYKGMIAHPVGIFVTETKDSGDTDIDEEILEAKAAEKEALEAVNIIKSYYGRDYVPRGKSEPEKLSYGDMAILLRATKSNGEIFYKALFDAGIPVSFERGEGYFETVEIEVFLNLLRLIDNRRQDIPLLSVLRFPSFGFTPDELAAIRRFAEDNGKRKCLYNEAFWFYCENGEEPLKSKCADFAEKLERWRYKEGYAPLGDFIWELLCESGVGDLSRSIPGGLQRAANLRLLSDKAEEFESHSRGGLRGFINYVETLLASGKIDAGQADTSAGSADAVRIMTIHKSKGLEFPMVMLCGLSTDLNRSPRDKGESRLSSHKDFGISLDIYDKKTGLFCKSVLSEIIKMQAKDEEIAERIRLLYVAMTRAENFLVLSGTADGLEKLNSKASLIQKGDVWNAGDYLSMILPILGTSSLQYVSLDQLTMHKRSAAQDRRFVEQAFEKGFSISEKAISDEELSERLYFTAPAPEGEGQKSKYSVTQLVVGETERGRELRAPLFLSAAPRMSGAERGTAFHKVMEHIPFTAEGKSAPELAAFIEELGKRNILTQAEAEAVIPEKIGAFFSSDIGRRVLAAETVRKEAPFTMRTELDGRDIMVQGTIDCCFLEDGEWVLVDYKSNYIDREHRDEAFERLKESYAPQLALYREALEKISGKPVKESVLYLFGTDEELRIE